MRGGATQPLGKLMWGKGVLHHSRGQGPAVHPTPPECVSGAVVGTVPLCSHAVGLEAGRWGSGVLGLGEGAPGSPPCGGNCQRSSAPCFPTSEVTGGAAEGA